MTAKPINVAAIKKPKASKTLKKPAEPKLNTIQRYEKQAMEPRATTAFARDPVGGKRC